MGLFGLGGPDSSSASISGCYCMAEMPGRTEVQALGLVEFTQKAIGGDAPKVTPSIFRSLLQVVQELGGAVMNRVKPVI